MATNDKTLIDLSLEQKLEIIRDVQETGMSYRNAANKYKNLYGKSKMKKMHIAHIMHNRSFYESKSRKLGST